MLRRSFISVLAAGVLAGPALAQIASPQLQQERRGDHDRGERGGGEVPFGQVQRELKQRYGGQLLDVSKQGGSYIVSWIDGDGRRLVIEVDAQSGRTVSVRGR